MAIFVAFVAWSARIEQFIINPTRVEFDEIMEQQIVFETYEHFKRIKIPLEVLYPF